MAIARQLPARQRIRKALLLVSFLLLPVTLYYFSPVLILGGAYEGVSNGSFLVFGLMFLGALFVGQLCVAGYARWVACRSGPR